MFVSGFSLRNALTALLALSATGTNARPLSPGHEDGTDKEWITVWGAMPQLTEPNNLPPEPFNETGRVFRDTTIRQTVKVSLAASELRLQISNAFGGSDLPITAVSVALPEDPRSAGGSAIQPSTARPVTFSGSPSFVVPNGALIVSDPIDIEVDAQSILSISIYLEDGQTTNDITSHPGSRTTSWLVYGDHTADEDLEDATPTDHWFLISSLQANLPRSQGASTVAIVGDSITDGRGSTTNANNRWPDRLLARFQGQGAGNDTANGNGTNVRPIAILNQGAGGNRVLADGLGPNALGRIERDVISHPGVRYAIIFIGVNDIGTAPSETAVQEEVGRRLVQAYQQMATRMRAHGLRVFGATITPMSGPGQEYGTPEREQTRLEVNAWIREEGPFDAVIDFDEIVRDLDQPERLRPEYDDGDYLHLNPDGYQAMADSIDLSIF